VAVVWSNQVQANSLVRTWLSLIGECSCKADVSPQTVCGAASGSTAALRSNNASLGSKAGAGFI
jgi:hypothetical protein